MEGPSFMKMLFLTAMALVVVQLHVINTRMNRLATGVGDLIMQIKGPQTVAVGDILSTTSARTIDGDAVDLNFDSPATLLVFVSPQCQPCTESIPEFRALHIRLSGSIAVVAVSTASSKDLGAYATEHELDLPMLSVSSEWAERSHLRRTPTTMLVTTEGEVAALWEGLLRPARTDEIVRRSVTTIGSAVEGTGAE